MKATNYKLTIIHIQKVMLLMWGATFITCASSSEPLFNRFGIVEGAYTWPEAKLDAEQRGGHLATFRSQAEWNSMITQTGLQTNHSATGPFHWLGATDETNEGDWVWVTGEPFDWTNWHDEQPDDTLGEEHYLADYPDYTWNDLPSPHGHVTGYIIEFEFNEFVIVPGEFSWHEAKLDAEQRGGHLATFRSPAEWHSMIAQTGLETNHPATGPFHWLGATNEVDEGEWQWVTGEPFDWMNWHEGQPDNNLGVEHYLADFPGYSWNDLPSPHGHIAGYIIEFEADFLVDTDGDGLPDYDEVNIHGTDPLLADSDDDDYSDKVEIDHNSNPMDLFDVPEILEIFTAIQLDFGTLTNKHYELQSSTNLTHWTSYTNVPGIGGKSSLLISIQDTEQTYWRLKVVTPE